MSDTHKTRGNELRLQKFRCKYDMHKFYFTNRVVDHWNSLRNWVLSASGVAWTKLKVGPGYMASAGARAYNGGLGLCPQRGSSGGGQGAKPTP